MDFFHIKNGDYILFDCLGHDLYTADREPDGCDEPGLIDMCPIEANHQDTPDRKQNGLTYTRMDCCDIYITSIIDFFHEKQCQSQKAASSKKYSHTHK